MAVREEGLWLANSIRPTRRRSCATCNLEVSFRHVRMAAFLETSLQHTVYHRSLAPPCASDSIDIYPTNLVPYLATSSISSAMSIQVEYIRMDCSVSYTLSIRYLALMESCDLVSPTTNTSRSTSHPSRNTGVKRKSGAHTVCDVRWEDQRNQKGEGSNLTSNDCILVVLGREGLCFCIIIYLSSHESLYTREYYYHYLCFYLSSTPPC